MGSSLFISYSHLDRHWMQVFQKHLCGTLMDRCRVWTDEDIPADRHLRITLRGRGAAESRDKQRRPPADIGLPGHAGIAQHHMGTDVG